MRFFYPPARVNVDPSPRSKVSLSTLLTTSTESAVVETGGLPLGGVTNYGGEGGVLNRSFLLSPFSVTEFPSDAMLGNSPAAAPDPPVAS